MLLALLLLSTPAMAQAGGQVPAIRVERLLSLGGDFGSATFADVADVATGPSGEVYVLDAGDKAVKVYSATGRFIRRFGRQGSGPGEFQMPVSIRVDSIVHVSDLGQRRMSYFSLDGRHLRTSRDPAAGDVGLLRVTHLRNGQFVAVTPAHVGVTADRPGRTGSPYSAVVFAAAGRAIDTLLRPHSGAASYHPRSAQLPFGLVPTHAGRGGAHAVLGDSIVATADGYTGEVRWYRADRQGLRLLRTRQLESRSRPVTPDDVRRMERDLYAQRQHLQRGMVIEPPPRISIATQALFSPDGSLWIRNTGGLGDAHIWTVLDAAGEVSIRLSLPAGFDLYHVRGDRLYGVTRTENDAPVVQVYRLVRG
jgi:hypothetical protein